MAMSGRRHAGKALMVLAAFLTATGQLFWKWGHHNLFYMGAGFVCYGAGAVCMIKAYASEQLSVAYPLMCLSYVFALIYGDLLLGEELTWRNTAAVGLIGVGVTLTSYDK
ncbi:EamA family transporter [Paenibacillus sp. 1P07SE]|uniref:EamA family transporter n=1 Tax=Paenibacillus sp. 1P07SE TaxID=3132209 RepID=UPI0039A43351